MPKFRITAYEREPEEPERPAALQCEMLTKIAEHTPEEYRLEKDSFEKPGNPQPLLPLSDE
jgi:hypothetical protein